MLTIHMKPSFLRIIYLAYYQFRFQWTFWFGLSEQAQEFAFHQAFPVNVLCYFAFEALSLVRDLLKFRVVLILSLIPSYYGIDETLSQFCLKQGISGLLPCASSDLNNLLPYYSVLFNSPFCSCFKEIIV